MAGAPYRNTCRSTCHLTLLCQLEGVARFDGPHGTPSGGDNDGPISEHGHAVHSQGVLVLTWATVLEQMSPNRDLGMVTY